jgi:DNA-directed RNA polymerase II subunit RPB2
MNSSILDDMPDLPWKIIDKYFQGDEHVLVKHQLSSYNLFMTTGLPTILRDENPISLEFKDIDNEEVFNKESVAPIRYTCKLYLGDKDGQKLYYGKPIIYDTAVNSTSESGDDAGAAGEFTHFMYPNEARLRNMTYGVTVHADVRVVIQIDSAPRKSFLLKRVYLGRFPIMVQSNLCILKGLTSQVRFYMGECRNDHGGYFIINGKEKVIISQEKFADNLLNIRVLGGEDETSGDVYTHSADIRTISEDPSKPVRTMSVRIVAPTPTRAHGNIVVAIPNVRNPVPLFIVMRALGIESDREIMEHCLFDLDANAQLLDLFVPSIHDANKVFTQNQALEFIGLLTKWKTVDYAHEVLINYFMPQVGEMNYRHKAFMLGYIVNKLIRVAAKIDSPTDRDSFCNKRVEVSGTMMYDLFREFYKSQFKNIRLAIDKEYYYQKTHGKNYQGANFERLISEDNYHQYFKERILETGVNRAFKGNWGETAHTKRIGVIQDLNRLSYNSFISHLRKINLEMKAGAKMVKPRLLHSSQWGLIDPVDVPDGANTGLHKHLAMAAHITSGCSAQPVLNWLQREGGILFVEECSPNQLFHMSKILVNGTLWGTTDEPESLINKFKFHRRIALIPLYISIRWLIQTNEIMIFTDAGRLCRPVFYHDSTTNRPSYESGSFSKYARDDDFSWTQLVSGFSKKREGSNFDCDAYGFYSIDELYETAAEPVSTNAAAKNDGDKNEESGEAGAAESADHHHHHQHPHSNSLLKRLDREKAVIEYIDQSETESALISVKLPGVSARANAVKGKRKGHTGAAAAAAAAAAADDDELPGQYRGAAKYTHYEIHPSLILGVMGNQLSFAENNQFPRDAFGCGQAKQTASLYHSNFFSRMDKMSMVINNGQVPLVKSRYLEYINNEEHPNGENAIVAIMCYGGYNVEDSILFNEGAIKRGLFNITYYNMYEDCEESVPPTARLGGGRSTHFSPVLNAPSVRGVSLDHDYTHLNAHGIVKEQTELTDSTVIIGKISRTDDAPDDVRDTSTIAKKGQLGFVDRTYMTESAQGTRLAKVRVREHRYPAVGDKFCSRCGQKGTVGFIVPERDMPFTADGTRPDIIINPHAIPSRMTVGQLVETIMGKACVFKGGFGDCTAFVNQGPRDKLFGDILIENNFHSSGNQILHNGMSGEQIECSIFMGPTYYMRLKQMVKDKINYRRTGPVTALTRQPVQGRANDGGLRIGEMERDSIISHGAARFLQESLMERGDQYYLAICNTTGMVAVYNESQNLFISPMADGPIKYAGDMNELKSARVVNVTRHGRSFSVVRVPYALKLLIQELQAMNVQMRIITDTNIDQIESMGFSNNINRLLMDDAADLTTVVTETASALGIKVKLASASASASANKRRQEDEFADEINVGMAAAPGNDTTTGSKNKRRRPKSGHNEPLDYSSMSVSEIERAISDYGWVYLDMNAVDGETYASIVTDADGTPTEYWRLKEHNHQYPNRFPIGWTDVEWMSSSPLDNADKVEALKLFPGPVKNNLVRAYAHMLTTQEQKYPYHVRSPKYTSLFDNDDDDAGAGAGAGAGARMGLGVGVLQHKDSAVLEARILEINKAIQQLEMEIEDVKSKAIEAAPSPSRSSPSGSLNVAIGPTKIIADKLREINALQTEREELISKLALNVEIEHRAIKHMTGTADTGSNSTNSTNSTNSSYNYNKSPEYGPSSPIVYNPGEQMMMSMRDGPVFQPATTQVIQQPFVQMPGQPPMMVMVPGTGLSMQPAMQMPVQTLTAAAATTAQQPNDTGLQTSKSSSSVDGSGKKTITFK